MLLADIKGAFAERNTDRLPSASLVALLIEIEGRPWAEYRAGKPMTQNQLARALKPLGIAPEVIREGDSTPRGYTLGQFTEAFERYLAPDGASEAQPRNKCDECSTSDMSQTATQKNDVAVPKSEKSNNDGLCCGVAVQKGDEGKETQETPLPVGSKVCGIAPGQRCEFCGAGREVYLIQLPDEHEGAPRHRKCAARYWACLDHPPSVDERRCGQCDGRPDGAEREYLIEGDRVWLHDECKRFYLKER
jgi:hypothetical protein